MTSTVRIPVQHTEHRCSRQHCGRVASAYLYEDGYGYRICDHCYAVLKAEGAIVSLVPPSADFEYPANA